MKLNQTQIDKWEIMLQAATDADAQADGARKQSGDRQDMMYAALLSMMGDQVTRTAFASAYAAIAAHWGYDPHPSRGGRKDGTYNVTPRDLVAVRSIFSRAFAAGETPEPEGRKDLQKKLAMKSRKSKKEKDALSERRNTDAREHGRRLVARCDMLSKHVGYLQALLTSHGIPFDAEDLREPMWMVTARACYQGEVISPIEKQIADEMPMTETIISVEDAVVADRQPTPKNGTDVRNAGRRSREKAKNGK